MAQPLNLRRILRGGSIFDRRSLASSLATWILSTVALSLLLSGVLSQLQLRRQLVERQQTQLKRILSFKADAFHSYLDQLRSLTLVLADDDTVVAELPELERQFAALRENPNRVMELRGFYQREVVAPLQQQGASRWSGFDVTSMMPSQPQGRALQQTYLLDSPRDPEARLEWPGPNRTAYDKLYRKVFESLNPERHAFLLHDLLLVDVAGNIVFSMANEADMGSNLLRDAAHQTNFGLLFEKLRSQQGQRLAGSGRWEKAIQQVQLSDLRPYLYSNGAPSFFTGTGIYGDGRLLGYMILQVKFEEFQKQLTSDYHWRELGLGEGGDLVVVDPSGVRVSIARLQRERPADAAAALRQGGVDPEWVDRMVRGSRGVEGVLQETTAAALAALAGRSGQAFYRNRFGQSVLGVYAPFEPISGGQGQAARPWALIAEIPRSEIAAPANQQLRDSLLNALLALAVAGAGSVLISRHAVTPLQRLQRHTRNLLERGWQQADRGQLQHELAEVRALAGGGNEAGALAGDLQALEASLFDTLDNLVRTGETVHALSAPVSKLSERVLILPLIGVIDRERGETIRRASLERIVRDKARVFIFDLAGLVDSQEGLQEFLRSLCGSVALMGCHPILTGISPSLAMRLSGTDSDLGPVSTSASLADAVQEALWRAANPGSGGAALPRRPEA
jgi:anti-anti-sigma regulatory factor